MRFSKVILGFSAGAFLMWRIQVPDISASQCVAGPDCAPSRTASAALPGRLTPAALQIVVYDRDAEPLPGPAQRLTADPRSRTTMTDSTVADPNPGVPHIR